MDNFPHKLNPRQKKPRIKKKFVENGLKKNSKQKERKKIFSRFFLRPSQTTQNAKRPFW